MELWVKFLLEKSEEKEGKEALAASVLFVSVPNSFSAISIRGALFFTPGVRFWGVSMGFWVGGGKIEILRELPNSSSILMNPRRFRLDK